jgi:hypothetical protein
MPSDEADVFLEARDLGGIDLKRNAMVSGNVHHPRAEFSMAYHLIQFSYAYLSTTTAY